MTKVTRATEAGRAYLDLQNRARRGPAARGRGVVRYRSQPRWCPGQLQEGAQSAGRDGGLAVVAAAARGLRGGPRGGRHGATAELASPHAALHIGPINIVLETAAMDIASRHAATDALEVESWTVMFVQPGVAGPFRAECEIVSGHSERIAVQLTLRDEGNEDRVVSVAKAVFRRVCSQLTSPTRT